MTTFLGTIEDIREEASEVKTFTVTKPSDFTFKPGQYCWLSLPDLDYSPSPMAIASGNDDTKLEFSVRAWGDLTNALFETSPGDKVELDGPYGTSFPAEMIENGTNLYLVAGGTGITPVRSLTRSLGSKGKKKVFYGAKNPGELLYAEEITNWPATINLTVDQADDSWEGEVGLVTNLLELEEFASEGYFFVCGPHPMEAAVVDYLREKGIADSRIYVSLEKFDDDGNVVGPVLPVTDEQVEF